jgi:hypothetical protein
MNSYNNKHTLILSADIKFDSNQDQILSSLKIIEKTFSLSNQSAVDPDYFFTINILKGLSKNPQAAKCLLKKFQFSLFKKKKLTPKFHEYLFNNFLSNYYNEFSNETITLIYNRYCKLQIFDFTPVPSSHRNISIFSFFINFNNKLSGYYLKNHLLNVFAKISSNIKAIKINLFIKTKNYHLTEKKLLSLSFNCNEPKFDQIKKDLETFSKTFLKWNLEEYYDLAEGSFFYMTINSLKLSNYKIPPIKIPLISTKIRDNKKPTKKFGYTKKFNDFQIII